MNDLKFMLSVVFSKTELTPLSGNIEIADCIKNIFEKEVQEHEIANEIENILQEQITYNSAVEIPEDYELNDL